MRRSRTKDELSDGDLLRLSAKGDEEAFVSLYRRHQGPVFRFAWHMSGCKDTAEEVTQDVFLALLAETPQYSSERGPLQAFLIGMARNKVRRQLERTRSLRGLNGEAGREAAGNSGAELLDGLNKEQEIELLRSAILNLPLTYREVMVLCGLEGMDYAQAAAQLGCPIGTVRSRLHRGRGILEAKMCRRERCPA